MKSNLLHRYTHSTVGLIALFLFVFGPVPVLSLAAVSIISFILRKPVDRLSKSRAAWYRYHSVLTHIAFPIAVIILVVPYWGSPWYLWVSALILVSTSIAMLPEFKVSERKSPNQSPQRTPAASRPPPLS